jgi:hypothetical protein
VETRKMKTERVKKVCPMCSELGDDKHVIWGFGEIAG